MSITTFDPIINIFNLSSDILMSNNSIYAEKFNDINLKNFSKWINWKWGTSKAKIKWNEMKKWMNGLRHHR